MRNNKSVIRNRQQIVLAKFKLVIIAFVLVCLGVVGVSTTFALLKDDTGSIKNTFVPAHVDSYVETDYKIQNIGDIDAYIRARVVVNYVDNDGNVYAFADIPEVQINTAGGWSAPDANGITYYSGAVAPLAYTATPVITALPENTAHPEYKLQVEIISEAIQAGGTGTTENPKPWGNN